MISAHLIVTFPRHRTHVSGRRARQEREAAQRFRAVLWSELCQHLFDANRIQHRLRLAEAHPRRCDAQQHAAAIRRVALAAHELLPLEPIDRERHRRHGDAHVIGEIRHRHRVDFVEVVEDARLVRADVVAGGRVADVPRVAREVDSRIGVEQRMDVTIAYFTLLCQTKISYHEKGGRGRRLRSYNLEVVADPDREARLRGTTRCRPSRRTRRLPSPC